MRRRLASREPHRIDDPSAREAAVAIVLVPHYRGGLDTLLIQRAEREGDPWSGQVAFPGGRRDPADEALVSTAIRETREEVGVDLRAGDLLGELDDIHPRSSHLPALIVRPFVFGLLERPGVTTSPEVASHRWVGLHEFRQAGIYLEAEIPSVGRRFPVYRLGGFMVWGMTERIITPFLHLAAGE
jgi:8-oxo-dGTP pyrophosphatase MutT (NUDIX family)